MRAFLGALGFAAAAGLALPAAAAPKPVPLVQDYEPRPAIWLLADEDTKIYLFGTIHMLPPGFKWRSPAVERAIAEADELVVETVDEQGADEGEGMALMLLDKPVPIAGRVPASRRKALERAIRQSRLPEPFYDNLRTWAAAFMMELGHIMAGYGVEDPDDAPGVEDVLEKEFRAAGKPISAVEDSEAVLRAVSALPESVHRKMLVSTVDESPTVAAEGAEDDRKWAMGEAEALAVEEEDDMPPAVYEIMLTKRNAAWTDWLIARLDKPGTVLFAVGAGHLAGKDKVQAMLEKRGRTVRRID